MHSPSAFSAVSVKPSFLLATPAEKLRPDCCCHPLAFMIAAIVVALRYLTVLSVATAHSPVTTEAHSGGMVSGARSKMRKKGLAHSTLSLVYFGVVGWPCPQQKTVKLTGTGQAAVTLLTFRLK